ncbi:MAG: thiolase domain-containing protein [Propionibacteriales bacterium]|nr:thiolase domain-containing protein [Propionibacteriales bacterium]
MNVYVAGTAMTTFGRHPEANTVELAVEAGRAALEEAGVQPEDVDTVYVGNFLGQSLHHQGVLASLVARGLGLPFVPATAVEGACASAGIALRHAVMSCRVGDARVALAIGTEQLTASPVPEVTRGLAEAMDRETDGATGLTFPGFFGLVAQAHETRYGTTREQTASVVVKNRRHGRHNPLAMFREEVTVDDVLGSRPIADPLRLYDCSPISDGAAAAVVTVDRPTTAQSAVEVLACEQASGPASISDIEDLTSFPATTSASTCAYARAGITAADLQVVELHDCFSVAEIVDCEDLGLLPRGEAGAAITDGATTFDVGKLVVNPSGGLLSRGHPVGATGLAQIHEITAQLRGTAAQQVEGAELGMAHNLGGCGASATVTILGRA